jgi:hypothetical protein
MHLVTPVFRRIALGFAPAVIVSFLLCATANAQYFPLPGTFFYAGVRPSNQVFDVSPDGKIAIALRNDPVGTHPAFLTTFHPILGTQLDSKTFGFGPLEVRLAQVGGNLRAVVLTSEGGPRRIYLFDVAVDGKLTQIASTQLTPSNTDGGSNLVLSGSGAVGFTIVAAANGELISFSLNDGSIIKRTIVPSLPNSLARYEGPGKRLLAFRSGDQFKVLDALDPAQPQEIASVPLVGNNEFSAVPDDGVVFSSDGRFAFLANQFFNFAAIDLNTKTIVGTIPGNFRFLRIAKFEDGQRRLLAILSGPAGTGGTSSLLLVDATNPAQLTIVNNITPGARTYFAFSSNGSRLYVADSTKLTAYNLPTFSTIWEQPVTGQSPDTYQLRVYGPDDEILGAWQVSGGLGFTSLFGSFPANPPNVALSNSISVAETAGVHGAVFNVSLSAPTTHRVTVGYATGDVSAQNGMDYTPVSGSLIFEPGQVLLAFPITILDDTLDEFDETFKVNISPNVGILQQGQSTVTILDDDPPPQLAIADTFTIEGTNVGRGIVFPVGLSVPSGKPVTVLYATADGTATTDDYIATNGMLTFAPGQTVANIAVLGKADRLNESNETVLVNLSSAVNATLVDSQGIGTILDDDPAVLATELNSQRAIALDAVTFVREPFGIENPNYFGTDKRSRIALFTTNLIHTPDLVVTAEALDDQQVVYPLTVEFVGLVPGFVATLPEAPFLTKIIVKLPDGITTPRDLQINITTGGRFSNKVLVAVKP